MVILVNELTPLYILNTVIIKLLFKPIYLSSEPNPIAIGELLLRFLHHLCFAGLFSSSLRLCVPGCPAGCQILAIIAVCCRVVCRVLSSVALIALLAKHWMVSEIRDGVTILPRLCQFE